MFLVCATSLRPSMTPLSTSPIFLASEYLPCWLLRMWPRGARSWASLPCISNSVPQEETGMEDWEVHWWGGGI
ncbi:hypothetical protein LEMLEM_LOCUS7629 [Lemmus lemmus]